MQKVINFLLVVFLLTSCRKDETSLNFTLPDKTQSGKNTIGFNLNGNVWTKYGQRCFLFNGGCKENPATIYRTSNNGDIIFYSDRILYKEGVLKNSETFGFYKYQNFSTTSIHNIKFIDNFSDVYFRDEITGKTFSCISTRETFQIRISKLDTTNKVIVGEFSGILFNKVNASDSIIITDGRFDLSIR